MLRKWLIYSTFSSCFWSVIICNGMVPLAFSLCFPPHIRFHFVASSIIQLVYQSRACWQPIRCIGWIESVTNNILVWLFQSLHCLSPLWSVHNLTLNLVQSSDKSSFVLLGTSL
jgi:hypothetical protein